MNEKKPNENEKEIYRKKIVEIVEKIENLAILEYFYIFIQRKVGRYMEEKSRID